MRDYPTFLPLQHRKDSQRTLSSAAGYSTSWYHVYLQYARYMKEASVSLREVRDTLGRRVDAAHFLGEVTVITKNREPRAVLVPYAWYIQRKRQRSAEPQNPESGPTAGPEDDQNQHRASRLGPSRPIR